MTTLTPMQLVAPQQIPITDTSFYQTLPASAAKVTSAVFTNTTGAPVTLTVAVTLAGGFITPATTVISARSVAPGESYVSRELAGAVIPAGSRLRAQAGTANALSIMVSGLTIV